MHTSTPANSIFDKPITNLLSILCILVEVLLRVHAKRRKCLNDFKSGASTGRFSSGGAASTSVKGLKWDRDQDVSWPENVKNTPTNMYKSGLHLVVLSVQFKMVYMRLEWPNALISSLRSFPNVAFETFSMFV